MTPPFEKPKSISETIKHMQARLVNQFGEEELPPIFQCDTASSEHQFPFGGMCVLCGREHQIPASPEALVAAEDLKQWFIDHELADANFQMVGVLVCLDDTGNVVTLTATSGKTPPELLAAGFCQGIEPDRGALAAIEREIIDLNASKEEAQEQFKKYAEEQNMPTDEEIAAEVEKEITKREIDPENLEKATKGITIQISKKLSKEKAKENSERLQQEKAEMLKTLNEAIRTKSTELTEAKGRTRSIKNFRNDDINQLQNIRHPNSAELLINGQLGNCAAPKLINQAIELGLTPISIDEFWWSNEKNTHGFKLERGNSVESCKHCHSILGHVLCGLEERASAQVAKHK